MDHLPPRPGWREMRAVIEPGGEGIITGFAIP